MSRVLYFERNFANKGGSATTLEPLVGRLVARCQARNVKWASLWRGWGPMHRRLRVSLLRSDGELRRRSLPARYTRCTFRIFAFPSPRSKVAEEKGSGHRPVQTPPIVLRVKLLFFLLISLVQLNILLLLLFLRIFCTTEGSRLVT